MKIKKETFIKLYNLVYEIYNDNQAENSYKIYIQTGLEYLDDRFRAVLEAYELGYNDSNADSAFYNGL